MPCSGEEHFGMAGCGSRPSGPQHPTAVACASENEGGPFRKPHQVPRGALLGSLDIPLCVPSRIPRIPAIQHLSSDGVGPLVTAATVFRPFPHYDSTVAFHWFERAVLSAFS